MFNMQSISGEGAVSNVVADSNPILKKAGEKVLRKLGIIKYLLEIASKNMPSLESRLLESAYVEAPDNL